MESSRNKKFLLLVHARHHPNAWWIKQNTKQKKTRRIERNLLRFTVNDFVGVNRAQEFVRHRFNIVAPVVVAYLVSQIPLKCFKVISNVIVWSMRDSYKPVHRWFSLTSRRMSHRRGKEMQRCNRTFDGNKLDSARCWKRFDDTALAFESLHRS